MASFLFRAAWEDFHQHDPVSVYLQVNPTDFSGIYSQVNVYVVATLFKKIVLYFLF